MTDTAGFHDGDKMVGAHRFSYELHKGQIPAGLIICHACDNPSCVNPDHLFLGTFRDNMDDAIRKNRRPVGESIHCAKLKNADILEIRRRLSLDKSRGITVRIAKDYGVSKSVISDIKRRIIWNCIP